MLRIGHEIIISDHKAAFSLDIPAILWRPLLTEPRNSSWTDAFPVSQGFFFALFWGYDVGYLMAGSGLIQYPQGEYVRRSKTVSSSRPLLFLSKGQ